MIVKLFILVFLSATVVSSAGAATSPAADSIIQLTEYGVKPNSFENASAAVRRAIIENGERQNIVFQLPEGRIDLWPDGSFKKELYISNTTENDSLSKIKNIGFLFEGVKNVTLRGNNTLIVLHGKMLSFAVIRSEQVKIEGVRFDYERPTMSEALVTQVNDTSAILKIHHDSRYLIQQGRITFYGEGWKMNHFHTIVFDTATATMRYSSFENFLRAEAMPQKIPGRVDFKGDFSKRNYSSGSVLTFRDPYRDNCGGFIWLSKNVKLYNVHMYYMHGLGIVSQFSDNLDFRSVHIRPRQSSGRIIAAFADGFHFSGCKGQILIDSCIASGLHDDPINVHGTHLKITEVLNANKLKVRFMHHQTYGFEAFFAGDSIAFINPETLQAIGYGRVKAVRLLNLREMELETEGISAATIPVGTSIENITWTPSVTIRNSLFERTNTRGILVTTRGKVVIENNVFRKTGMHAILIANDAASWYESGPVRDVTIRNNLFEECGYNQAPSSYVIAIAPENIRNAPGYYVHRNISVVNNIFKLFDAPVLTAKSLDGLIFRNNTLAAGDPGAGVHPKNAFVLNHCSNVVIAHNTNQLKWPLKIELKDMSSKQVKTDLK